MMKGVTSIPHKPFFEKLLQVIDSGFPFVAYRKPGNAYLQLWVQQHKSKVVISKFREPGFVMAPFDLDSNETYLFPLKECDRFETPVRAIPDSGKTGHNLSLTTFNPEEKEKHIDLVARGVSFIRSGKVEKIVLSRKEQIPLAKYDASTWFTRLLQRYPDAFVYWWSHPAEGMWMGATPETLLKTEGNRFSTMALAGTQVFNAEKPAIWGAKEQKEQQLVTDYICAQLEGLDFQTTGSFSKKAGNLVHICTGITGKLTQGTGNLIERLHPTPAVCGLPPETAKAFIRSEEAYDREFYTGFLGELHLGTENEHTSELFVNLRCMQIDSKNRDRVALYIGGGITADSDPEKEWEETIAKSATLKTVL